MPQPTPGPTNGLQITRRAFLGSAAAAGGIYLVACSPDGRTAGDHDSHAAPASDGLRFFTQPEAIAVDAIIARLIPGDEDDPGAREAGVLWYIDGKLAEYEQFAEPTYIRGPFAEAVEEDERPEAGAIGVADDQLYRYGFQSEMIPREVYREGLVALGLVCEELFGTEFHAMSPADQDALLAVLDDIDQSSEPDGEDEAEDTDGDDAGGDDANGDDADGDDDPAPELVERIEEIFGDVDPGSFFSRIRTDTIEGMFADPMYGGNRDMSGWAMIGYPGPQRAWSPPQMLAVGIRRRPSSLEDMPHMNPDVRDSPAREAMEQPRRGVVDG